VQRWLRVQGRKDTECVRIYSLVCERGAFPILDCVDIYLFIAQPPTLAILSFGHDKRTDMYAVAAHSSAPRRASSTQVWNADCEMKARCVRRRYEAKLNLGEIRICSEISVGLRAWGGILWLTTGLGGS
jgi:hypothetical protein